MSEKIIVIVNIMGEILSRDVTFVTCRQKIIVIVNIMGEILQHKIKNNHFGNVIFINKFFFSNRPK